MTRNEPLRGLVCGLGADEGTIAKYTAHLEELLEVVDGSRIGEDYRAALAGDDIARAVHLLASYYRNRPAVAVPSLTADGGYSIEAADRTVRGMMREVSIDWTFADGNIDFLFDPTALHGPRNHEWLWQLNRHGYWRNLARTYRGTHDEVYARAFRDQLLAWIAQTDIPEQWNGPGSAWRTIECGIRLLGTWQMAFDGFRTSPAVEDAVLLLMIASMHRQSLHLVAHPTTKNWLMMESNGVYTFSALFDELTDSRENRRIATERLLWETAQQILPDGMHNELSPDYHAVVCGCASGFLELSRALGYASEIPEGFPALIAKTVGAAISLTTPALTQPRTNDTFTIPLSSFTGSAEELLGSTPQYRYFNSGRAQGEPPAGETASVFLPYAGFAAMRSDWGADAVYLCFDVGPLGMAHIHQDMLSIQIYRGCEELLYDDGGGQYEDSEARRYALSAYAHNTVLVDGLAQNRRQPYAVDAPIDAKWVSTPQYDYAEGCYDAGFGTEDNCPARHTRQVRFCKPGFFCITDHLASKDGAAHDYEVLFHLDTTRVSETDAYPGAVLSDFGRQYDLLMIPLDDPTAEVQTRIVSAQTEPVMRGWYNGRNDRDLHAAATVSRYVHDVRDYRFTTLLFPMRSGDVLPTAAVTESGEVSVTYEGKTYSFRLHDLRGE